MRHKVGIYLRVSTDEQAQVVEGSLDSQKHRLMSFVDIKNTQEPKWGKVIETYSDEGVSAKDTRRPQFQRMMSDLRKGKINLILVTDLSRLSRNILDFCLLLEDLKRFNAKFLSMKEQFDTSTPAGEMMVFNMINLAQFERKQTSERISLNFHSRALRGLSNGGPVPLGFEKDPANPSALLINQAEARNVREIFRLFLEARSCRKLIPVLEANGISPKVNDKRNCRLSSRGIWTRQTLLKILRNPAYVGLREVNLKNKGKDPETLKSWGSYQIVKASWKPIVEKEAFDLAQDVLDDAEKIQRHRLSEKDTRVFILSGLLRCMECGATLSGAASHGKYRAHKYYIHRKLVGEELKCKVKRFRADEVEAAVIKHLSLVIEREGHMDGIEKRIEVNFSSRAGDLQGRKTQLEECLRGLEKEITSVFELHTQIGSGTGVDLIKERLSKLSESKAQTAGQINELNILLEGRPSSGEARRVIENNLGLFHRGWKKGTPAEQKSLMHLVFDSLVVTPDGIHAYYHVTEKVKSNVIQLKKQRATDNESVALKQVSNFPYIQSKKSFAPDFRLLSDARASMDKNGGRDRDRTCDLKHAMLPLSQTELHARRLLINSSSNIFQHLKLA